jgi:hypothetical protein
MQVTLTRFFFGARIIYITMTEIWHLASGAVKLNIKMYGVTLIPEV